MDNSVWIILEQDNYGDERVEGVCSSKDIADLTVRALSYISYGTNSYEVKEYPTMNDMSRECLDRISEYIDDAEKTINELKPLKEKLESLL